VITMTQPDNLSEFIVRSDSGQDLVFKGRLLAHASSAPAKPTPRARWTELNIWETQAHAYVCQVLGCSTFLDEITFSRAEVYENAGGAADMFAKGGHHGWLAKQLLQAAGLERYAQLRVA
ncbi:MAG: hypothetical protein DRP42_06595, partial [Tenericutes bacterium]